MRHFSLLRIISKISSRGLWQRTFESLTPRLDVLHWKPQEISIKTLLNLLFSHNLCFSLNPPLLHPSPSRPITFNQPIMQSSKYLIRQNQNLMNKLQYCKLIIGSTMSWIIYRVRYLYHVIKKTEKQLTVSVHFSQGLIFGQWKIMCGEVFELSDCGLNFSDVRTLRWFLNSFNENFN